MDKYKETLERAKELYQNKSDNLELIETLEFIFPEIEEEEDEKIRTWLEGYFLQYKEDGLFDEFSNGLTIDRIITWIRKQGKKRSELPNIQEEQKLVFFKVGDWVVDTSFTIKDHEGCIGRIKEITDNYYTIEECSKNCGTYIHTKGRYLRPWTVEDAKSGDILHVTGCGSECIFIFNDYNKWKYVDKAVVTGYCCIHVYNDRIEFGTQGPDCVEIKDITPATKVQRDLLSQEMEKAGYKWDPDKKELRENT